MDNDDILAPLVDGLSGSLCILVLVTLVFMAAGTDIATPNQGKNFFKPAVVNIDEKRVNYSLALNLKLIDIHLLRKHLDGLGRETINLYILEADSTKNRKNKMVYNLLRFKSLLGLKANLKFNVGVPERCGPSVPCIYWD